MLNKNSESLWHVSQYPLHSSLFPAQYSGNSRLAWTRIQGFLSCQFPVKGYDTPLGRARPNISHSAQLCGVETKFHASTSERSEALFLRPVPIQRADVPCQVWHTEDGGPDCPCPSLFKGQRFHAGRGKLRRPEAANSIPLLIKQGYHSQSNWPLSPPQLQSCGSEILPREEASPKNQKLQTFSK